MLETPRASQELGVEYRKAFWEVFQSAPKARAMSADGVSYVLRGAGVPALLGPGCEGGPV